ncbi:D-2-hydroxyacid dehydrogenase family protein [Telmatospirillum sp. J64-1]|uniref:D-2-hydroxyacid dehydrogenase family protein n=1 Tax=Telmatospirillum sp. J64-1 TaxID=2502183 RepID=UPI00115CC901|nr:D-2-hydroxyacid dehydrogenase family protein [Telmatospirillum sp. J64-1]
MRIAILDDYQGVSERFADWSRLPPEAELTVFRDTLADEQALVERLEPFNIVCLMRERTPFPASLIRQLPNLKLIVTTGQKNAAIDVAAARAQGVTVCGTQSPGHATAELTMALILAQARMLVSENASMREGGWQVSLGRDLRGATLGIIGLGRLGGQVATYAKAFGMKLLAWSENLTQERCDELGVEKAASKQDLLKRADFVTIHQRLSSRTRGLIGPEDFAVMKPDAYLVNTSRGEIVHWQALLDALEAGQLAGAALDVYDVEPLPADHPLRASRKLLLTPHIGYVTRETYEVFYGQTLEAVLAFLKGEPIRVMEG